MTFVSLGKGVWKFTQLDSFWPEYRPLTPWGKDEADRQAVYNDPKTLKARYDDIEQARSLLLDKSNHTMLDRISYHLKRMPRLPLKEKSVYELIELFQIKKFIANYRGLVSVLDTDLASFFGLFSLPDGSKIKELASLLDSAGSDPETFFLADSFDEELKEARAGIADCNSIVIAERLKREAELRLQFAVSFDGREFLLLPKEKARAIASSDASLCSLEPYDDSRFIVRLMPSGTALEAMVDREAWLAKERIAENRVLASLSISVAEAMPEIRLAVEAISRWDRARAGAELALKYNMTRPHLDGTGLELIEARFIPCQEECASMDLSYTPLTAKFYSDAVVLFGSNMGGKTVVLKTIMFFQLLAQAGLFVPAKAFHSKIYDSIVYVGELDSERLAGLSGFGMEVWRLESAWQESYSRQLSSLVAFDELARTTGSHEAEALLSAVIEAYAANTTGTTAFFATHFKTVARVPGAEYRRMRGLDRAKLSVELSKASAHKADTPLTEEGKELEQRLAGINHYMRYEIIEDDASIIESDAIAIASLLGLEQKIVQRAQFYLGKKEGI